MFIPHNDWFNPFHSHNNNQYPFYFPWQPDPWQWHQPPQNPYQPLGIDILNKSTQFLTAADTNNDGVTSDELTAQLDRSKTDTQYDTIRQFLTSMRDNFSFADLNGDTKLSLRESLGYLVNQATKTQEPIGAGANYVDLYNFYNTDGTAGISKAEFNTGFLKRHPGSTETQRNDLFGQIDLDGNGTISPEEFVLREVNRDQNNNANISGNYLNHFLRDLFRNPFMRFLMPGLGSNGQDGFNSWNSWDPFHSSNSWNPFHSWNSWDPFNSFNSWNPFQSWNPLNLLGGLFNNNSSESTDSTGTLVQQT